MTLRELLADNDIDPNALLRQHIGQTLDHGGITVSIADGQMDIHIFAPVFKQQAKKPAPAKRKPRQKSKQKSRGKRK